MSVGTGIFLAGALLAVVALYIATKDRWNWMKTIILWPLGVTLTMVTGFYLHSLIPEKPKVEKTFWEIPLGASQTDVLFIRGKPSTKESDRWVYSSNTMVEAGITVTMLDSWTERCSSSFLPAV
jgi:hypothetical protein